MPTVVIQHVVPAGDDYSVRGTVDGRGYVIAVPRSEVAKARDKAGQQMVITKALAARDDQERPSPVGLAGTVTL